MMKASNQISEFMQGGESSVDALHPIITPSPGVDFALSSIAHHSNRRRGLACRPLPISIHNAGIESGQNHKFHIYMVKDMYIQITSGLSIKPEVMVGVYGNSIQGSLQMFLCVA